MDTAATASALSLVTEILVKARVFTMPLPLGTYRLCVRCRCALMTLLGQCGLLSATMAAYVTVTKFVN